MSAITSERPVHSPEFRRRRALNWLTLGFTYASMYMGRYNLSFANKSLSDTYGWDKTQIGSIITIALTIYGVSALFNGPIADRIGGRKAMLIGVFGAVVFNIAFGLGAYIGFLGTGNVLIGYFASAWALNMYFQSYSALALIKVNSGWFHVRERGVFSAIFGSMIQSGRALIFFVGGIAVTFLPWQWVFFIPAGVMALMGVLTYFFVRDNPEDTGHPSFDTADASSGDTDKVNMAYLAKKVFTNPVTLTIAFAEFCTGFVRHGFEQWFPRYMQEAQHLPLDSGVFQKGAMSVVIAGIVGAFAAGTISDWVFKSRRPPVAFVGYVLQIVSLAVIWMAPSLELIIGAFVLNSFAISMVHSMLSGTASMDFGGKKAAASATGMFDGMQYIGGAAVGIGMGWMLESFGWGIWGPSMIGFSFIGLVLMLKLWNAVPKGRGGH
ncbi:MAG: MFS transporter [Bacteroidetes bacterium]|jgi:OPA family glycerol-3-phosphate transporter-like MFS transporter|nr:MFS transporter [Bacteroidota bacterium]